MTIQYVKPMLAANAINALDKLPYPMFVSPKLDGVRAIVKDGVVYSRLGKAIPNCYVQQLFSTYNGFDGELIVGDPTSISCFRDTTSGVMSVKGEPDVTFYVFDKWDIPTFPYGLRNFAVCVSSKDLPRVKYVDQLLVSTLEEVKIYEEKYLTEGYEGIMLRLPTALYKYGRSTLKEAALLKVKRFEDGEAIVIGFEERMHNGNEATVNALGYTERSAAKDGKVGMDTLGALIVQDIALGVKFNIGTGFDDVDRIAIWKEKEKYLNALVKYKYFPTGGKDKPRFPVFIGWRSSIDL